MPDSLPTYTNLEQKANRVTHGFAAVLSLAGLIILIVQSSKSDNLWYVISCTVFGLSLILLYTSSTLYHTLTKEKYILFLRKMDHASIFILIAGTYTPILIIIIEGSIGKILFIIIWVLATVGVILKLFGKMKSRMISIVFYLAMGWMCIIPGKQIMEHIPKLHLILIAIGGLAYTIGVIFYLWRRLPYNHAIWHLFVMSGSFFHFLAVYYLL